MGELYTFHRYLDAKRNKAPNSYNSAIEMYDDGNVHWEARFDDNDHEVWFKSKYGTRNNLYSFKSLAHLAAIWHEQGKAEEIWHYGYDSEGNRVSCVKRDVYGDFGPNANVIDYKFVESRYKSDVLSDPYVGLETLIGTSVKNHSSDDYVVIATLNTIVAMNQSGNWKQANGNYALPEVSPEQFNYIDSMTLAYNSGIYVMNGKPVSVYAAYNVAQMDYMAIMFRDGSADMYQFGGQVEGLIQHQHEEK